MRDLCGFLDMISKSIRSCFLIIALLLIFTTAPVYGQGEIKIGVLASRGANDTLKTWQPTAEYLSKEIPQYSFVIVPLDIDEIAPAVDRKEVDFVITNPSNYVELEATYGATRIATMESKYGGHYYEVFSSVIFRRADMNGIRDLNDLKGKSFMAVQENIFSWQMAWREFKDKGIDPYRDFKMLKFSGLPQDLVVYAVRDGKADAGAVRTGILESMASEGKINLSDFVVLNPQYHDFPLLHSTGFYPEWAFAMAKHTSEELAGKVAVALLNMPADSAAAKAANAVWTVPLDYQPVRELMTDLRIGPCRDYGKITAIDVIKNYWYWIFIAVAAVLFVRAMEVDRINKKLRQEITERKNAEGALKESEEKFRSFTERSFDIISMLDAEGRFTYVSPIVETVLGFHPEEIIGRPFQDFIPESDIHMTEQAFNEAINGNLETIVQTGFLRKDGEFIAIEGHGTPIIKDGKMIGVQAIIRDITARKQAEEALKESEERFRSLVQSALNAVVITDTNGKIILWNKGAEKIFLYTEKEVLGKPLTVLMPDRYRDAHQKGLERAGSTGKSEAIGKTVELHGLRKDGSEFPIEISLSTWTTEKGVFYGGIIHDITKRKQNEEALLWESNVNASIAELSIALILQTTIEEISSLVMEHAKRLTNSKFGYTGYIDLQTGYLVSPTLSRDIWEVCNVKDKNVVFEKFTGLFGWVLNNRKPLLTNAPDKDPRSSGTPEGHIPIQRFLSVPAMIGETLVGQISVANSDHDYIDRDLMLLERLGTIYAIALQRKKTEEALQQSEEKHRTLIENIQDGVFIIQDAKIQFANEAFARIGGYAVEEVIGMDFRELVAPEDMEFVANNYHRRQAGEYVPREYEFGILKKDKSRALVNMNAGIIAYGGRVATMGTVKDITEPKKAEEQLNASLKEKELLLREIHHRVKNNIQVISSMLSLQSEYIKEEKYRDMFRESQNRILSMALIHEKLYQSRDFTKIDFNDYVRDLVYDLFEYYGANTGNIALNINVENVSLGIDSAIPCGLIINELVTNSLKYAFPDGRKGELKISLSATNENMVELIISDNGIGIPEDLDFRNTQSLGLHLVTILVENQLHGEINLDRSKGTEFRIKFKGGK